MTKESDSFRLVLSPTLANVGIGNQKSKQPVSWIFMDLVRFKRHHVNKYHTGLRKKAFGFFSIKYHYSQPSL